MKIIPIPTLTPRNIDAHGLFGVKWLKHHQMYDDEWTPYDLVEQYERVSNIYERENAVKSQQNELNEIKVWENYRKLQKDFVEKTENLKTLLEGDFTRTKNILQSFPEYWRVYYKKRSEEVLEELDNKIFLMRKSLDRYVAERARLIKEYEKRLLDVAKFQEMIRYYDIKEFEQERKTKRLYVELKDSETRIIAIEKINLTYKMIIDQMLHDSLYYLPVLEALNSDWNEQAIFVQQIYNIGYPAIQRAKNTEKEVKKLTKLCKKEERIRFDELLENRNLLKDHPKKIKQLVRRDSDFDVPKGRYLRDTQSIANLKKDFDKLTFPIDQLKTATLSKSAKDIVKQAQHMMTVHRSKRDAANNATKHWHQLIDQNVIVNFVHGMLLDDEKKLYDDEYFKELNALEEAIKVEKNKQQKLNKTVEDRKDLQRFLLLCFQHMGDVVQDVGTKSIYKKFEYPEGMFPIPYLKFFHDIPKPEKSLQTDIPTLLNIIKSKAVLLMNFYEEKKKSGKEIDFSNAVKTYQKAVVDNSINTFRPPAVSFDFSDE